MKHLLFLLLTIAAFSVQAQTITVPDANFRNFLATNYAGTSVSGNTVTFTTPSAASITTMICNNQNIADLTGIAAFTGLLDLRCNGNLLTSLNVSANTLLRNFDCRANQLTSLDVSANTALQFFDCSNNQLTSLNLSTNTALTNLQCRNNRIPIVLISSSSSPTITKDAVTQVAVFRNNVASPIVPLFTTGGFVLGTSGAIVNLTANTGPAGSLISSTSTNPTIVGPLPTGTARISPDKFWTITATSFTGTYNLILDMTGITGITNFTTLKVLKRANSSSAWEDVAQPPINATVEYLQPFIIVSGLTSFSDFAIGAGLDNPLPVELSEFRAQRVERGVELVWATASEKNNAGFEVQARTDKGQVSRENEWRVLGFVKGNGTTSDAKSYSFMDRTATGKVQYRLKQIDFDGTFEILPTVEVDAGVPRTFELGQNYPNPFNPTTAISYQLPVASEVSLKVYDLLGREVATLVNGRQEAGRYSVPWNAASLSSGVYFYRLQASATNGASSSNFVQTRKMMLVK